MGFLQLQSPPPPLPPQLPATGSWAGVGAATFIGAALTMAVLAPAGAGAATFVGAATTNGVLSASGAGSAAFIPIVPTAFAAAGSGTASWVGASTAASVLNAAGAGVASWVGTSLSGGTGILAAAGSGTASWVGASTSAQVLSAAGAGAAAWTAIGGVPLAAAGAGTASWVGASTAASTINAAGVGTASWLEAPSIISAAGVGTASWVGASSAASVLSSTGMGSAAWVAFQPSTQTGALAAAGRATVAFVSLPALPPPTPLPAPPPSTGQPACTDLDVLDEIQLTLQEDATFSNGLWSLQEVVGYMNQRQYRFLFETKMLAALATIRWIPEQEQMPLPNDWIVTIAANWHDYATGEIYPLPRTDRFEMDRLLGPTVAITVALPQGFREADTTETLSIAVAPAPSTPGALSLLYVSLSEVLDGTGQLFDIPCDWVPYIKYGVYADMLGKHGRGQDLLRARYAEQRFQEGIVLAKSLMEGWP